MSLLKVPATISSTQCTRIVLELSAEIYGAGIFNSKDGLMNFESIQSGTDKGLQSNYITYFFEDASHTLWVATEGGGLCKTSLEGGISFTHITRNDGLPSNIACAVTQDQKG